MDPQPTEAELRIVGRMVALELRDLVDAIEAEAAKFRFPEEREYRAGLRDARSILQRRIMELERA